MQLHAQTNSTRNYIFGQSTCVFMPIRFIFTDLLFFFLRVCEGIVKQIYVLIINARKKHMPY